MKKSQINAILVDETKRKNKIISYLCFSIFIFLISILFLILYMNNNKKVFISYKENSDITYKVYLKNNDFFNQNYLNEENRYIANLIDYIDANFIYNLNIEDIMVDYKYQYRITSLVEVKEKNDNNPIYKYEEDIISNKTNISRDKKLNISENIKIDYNKYNDIIKKLISIYDLTNTESTLKINLYVKILGECDNIDDINNESVIRLNIPLTTKTVGIDIKSNLIDSSEEKYIICNDKNSLNIIFLIISIIIFILGLIIIIYCIKYYIDTRTAETLYQKELKKILNNYGSYIQKTKNILNLDKYELIKIENFNDMLEIRDTIGQPILMVENKEQSGVYFMIPSNTQMLYIYSLKISDIKDKMIEK